MINVVLFANLVLHYGYTVYGKIFEGENLGENFRSCAQNTPTYSLENFRGASGPYHYVLYTANDSRGKLVSARGFWEGNHQRTFFDVRVFNPVASRYRTTATYTPVFIVQAF